MSLLQQLDSSPKVRMRQPECLSPRQQVKTLGMASCGLTALAILMGGGGGGNRSATYNEYHCWHCCHA